MRSIEELERLLEKENQKDANDRDFDLIESLVAEIMEQSHDGKLSPEEREQEMGKIKQAIKNEEKPKKPKSFKALLVAAIVTVLLLVANFTAMACGVDTVDILRAFGDKIIEMVVGEKEEFMGVEIIKMNKSIKYDNIEEFTENENYDIIFPSLWPEDVHLKEIRIQDSFNDDGSVNTEYTEVYFLTNDSVRMSITANPNVSKDFIYSHQKTEVINELTCYMVDDSEVKEYRAYFFYNDYIYKVNARTYDDVVLIIEGLVESSEVVAE